MGNLRRKGLVAALLTLAVTAALCLLCYRFDNKYTHGDAQPISGILPVAQAELVAAPVRYLVREWEFYPGQLLSPGEAEHYTGYRTYRSIGETAELLGGQGTYRLTLLLPDTERDYALELPEVFSSYYLYVDGRLILTMGSAEPDAYEEHIASRTVLFSAAGPTELLLAVCDRSGVYSGLVYPPAFGEPSAVLAARELRLLVHGAAMLLAVLGMALAVSFGLWGGRWRGALFFLCCLCFFGIVGYPVLHGFFGVSYQPWYTLEIACFYGLLLAGVLLECELYGVRTPWTLALSAPCVLGLLAAVVRVGCAGVLSAGLGSAFSVACGVLKYYAGGCLLALSVWALLRQMEHSIPLLCACVSLGVCLLMDRALPLYEPIFGGWFIEWGGLALTGVMACVLWGDAVSAYRFRLVHEAEYRQMKTLLSLQQDHYRRLRQQIDRTREASHDLRHHMRALRTLAQQGQLDQIILYLDDYEPHLAERELTIFSDHPTADAVLNHYAAEAARLNAVYDVRLAVSAELDFPGDELCVILGNLLENAMEALARQPEDNRRLYLRGDAENGRLGLVMDNTCSNSLEAHGNSYLSTKHEGDGLGLSSIRTVVEKHGGLVDFSIENNVFHAMLIIPLS